ncbi:MAG: serine hydrolase [Clostridia bacterium]|nr:serine hydrolase [Clostridia bacterium]MBQ7120698.1 serine hydrolase [Clostridia bacterium]
MADIDRKSIPNADFPEQVGISSNEIEAFIKDIEASGIEAHSMKIIRHGKTAFECYRHPYNSETPHIMYSVSKSFTSVAMGFAIDEGLVKLDTKVIDIFPEYRPKKYDDNLEKMTVYHLLTMTAGKDVSLISDKTKGDWVGQFFSSRWGFAPGEGWKYISENTYMCCAIIKRLTGMGVIDYLKPKLFEPLGITRRPFWESDPEGLEAGGWGLFITTDELARFTLCLHQGGVYDGVQVIPAWYVEEATKKQVENPQYSDRDACCGYGYFFWLNDLKNSYRSDGMFSQFGISFADYDAVLAFTCSEVFEQKARDCIFRHFPHMFIDECETEPEDAVKELSLLPLSPIEAAPRSVLEEFVAGKIIHFGKNLILNAAGWPVSMLPMAVVYMSANRAGNIDNVILEFNENECTMTWDEGKEHNTVVCGMDGKERYSKIRLGEIKFTAVSSAAWRSDSVLEIRMRPLESICERRITLEFKGQNVTLTPSSSPPLSTIADSLKDIVKTFLPNEKIAEIGGKAFVKLEAVVEAPLFGKMV